MELRRSPRFQILSRSGERIGVFTEFENAKAAADRFAIRYKGPFDVYRVESVYRAEPEKAETAE